jgi:hypothetical protein
MPTILRWDLIARSSTRTNVVNHRTAFTTDEISGNAR